MARFADLAFTERVRALQEKYGSRAAYARRATQHSQADLIGEDERAFIEARDSFYLATIGETGWPYVQHRGGPAGFLRVLDERTLAFADFLGNKQYISVGNLQGNDRAALFLMDYPNQARLKILAHARIVDAADDPALMARLAMPGYKAKIERAIVFDVEGFDWNCPQHITPRFTAEEVATLIAHDREESTES